jgi:hypothetical protein
MLIAASEALSKIEVTASNSSIKNLWQEHGYILPAFCLTILVCAWFVTWGDWNFFAKEDFCDFYDAQARSTLASRLDVPPAAIGTESFTFHGRTYGYFGIAPSLLRIPFVAAFGNMDGRWSHLMMLIASTINLLCAYRFLQLAAGSPRSSAHRMLNSLVILCAGVGSTNVFLVARSFTFHEAIMWSATFGLLFALTTFKYLARPRLGALCLSGLFAFMSLHSRATVGAGALLGLAILSTTLVYRAIKSSPDQDNFFGFGDVRKPWLQASVATGLTVFIAMSYLAINYAKFHTFDSVPLKYYDFYVRNPIYLQMTGGRQIHLENIPTAIASYLGFHPLWLSPMFPWIFPSREATFIGDPAIMVVEGFSTFPVSMPALFVLALLGCRPLICDTNPTMRRLRIPVIAMFAGGAVMLATVAITERYLHDFYPTLIILAAIGVGRLVQQRYLGWATIGVALLSVISFTINSAFAIENQRLDAWSMGGVPQAKRAEFKQTQKSIYRILHR